MTKRIRHFLTGEWIEVPLETDGTRTVVSVIEPSGGTANKSGNIWRSKEWSSMALAVHPKQARAFTQAAHALGITDVHYCEQTGKMKSTSREGRAAEAAHRGRYDADGGCIETKFAAMLGY